jgi:hypothetical protein
VVATWASQYIEQLRGTRYEGRADSVAAGEGTNRWIAFFSAACRRAASDATAFEDKVESIAEQWRDSLGSVRAGSAAELLLAALPGAPVVSVTSAAQLISRSFQATNAAMKRLQSAGIVEQVNIGRRNRAFEARAIIEAFTGLERQLTGSTLQTLDH